MAVKTKLWEGTRDLHHACEQHPIGQAMASGSPKIEVYYAWVDALSRLHKRLDPFMPEVLHRTKELREDLEDIIKSQQDVAEVKLNKAPPFAKYFAKGLQSCKNKQAGASYVLAGAGLMGGALMVKALGDNYPTAHLQWEDRRAALDALGEIRENGKVIKEARECFAALLQIMDEIEEMTKDA
tara:strand:- start:5222 stop:5770 length:549 start_codon:yes stop_codon:yes gene_type:complete